MRAITKFIFFLWLSSIASITTFAADETSESNVKEKIIEIEANEEEAVAQPCKSIGQYTFSWNISEICNMKPRGGTSRGAKITLDARPHPGWLAIQAPNLSTFEKDRQAILAMQGPYRVSFDFLETMGFVKDYSPSNPYQSWGTEYVYVAQDDGDYISLQHIMVMVFVNDEGKVSEPMIMKHWRQDWEYEKPFMFEYAGRNTWEKRALSPEHTQGKWSQSVYQVDDSPRYESIGAWRHEANFSSWLSATTWRPLPRRESSIRSDYHVLQGTNKHIILPSGWVQEQNNYKVVLDEQGKMVDEMPFLAKEIGLARYKKIVEHDFTPADEYWEKSGQFWQDVRDVWSQKIQEHDSLTINKRNGSQMMFMPFFSQAQNIVDGEEYDADTSRAKIKEMLVPFVE